jgi:peptide-methionine (R)-S-oxide reductase
MPTIHKPDAEWHALLTTAQFAVLRKAEDERKGTHPLIKEVGRGNYLCAGCFSPLFESSSKFADRDYPSFYEANPGAVEAMPTFASNATRYRCRCCGGYQGQMYNDGPQPTGKRYSNNGEGLLFVPRGQPLPPLRG